MKKTYYFIVNTKARTGKGIVVWHQIEQALKEKNINYKAYRTAHAGHAKELAEKITSMDEERTIVILGGDGTINEVLNGVRDFSKVKFGYIPMGSANDFAKGLGIRDIPALDLLDQILELDAGKKVDLGRVTGDDGIPRYFGISSGFGIDAEVCYLVEKSKVKTFLNAIHLGALSYKVLTIKALLTMPHVKCEITLDDQEAQTIHNGIFTCGMNTPWEGGGVPMAPSASPNDGQLSLCCVHGFNKLQVCYALPQLLAAKHEGKKGFWLENFTKAEFELEQPMALHFDGELGGIHQHIVMECLPGYMELLCR